MSFRVAVDIGGTFTDVVIADEHGRLTVSKAPTRRERVYVGIREALEASSADLDGTPESILAGTEVFVYATTHATNAILEGSTAKTAFLTTAGFPDVLVLREGGRRDAFDFDVAFPRPYVPRHLTYEIPERIDSEGQVVDPLDEEAAFEVLKELRDRRVEAVGVSLLWSIVNPEHELALGRLIQSHLSGVPYTLGHQLNPVVREYRRASASVIDASLKPLMQRHLQDLADDLRNAGFDGEILMASPLGGVMRIEDMIAQPIYAVRSGPASAPVAGRLYAGRESRGDNVIVCDTGGTSFDVSLVRDGEMTFTRETWLGEQFTGHLTGLAAVDARSIGAGGGSIAWLDPGGLLRVGPHSAGAFPGPACYGRGGSEPTVTDAAALLGYLNPEFFLAGRMPLDLEAASRAITPLAESLRRTLHETAAAILTIANEQMVRAIQEITVKEGVDPREALVVAGGGAAGLNIVPIAVELGCSTVLIPRTAGALTACGVSHSNIVAEFSQSFFTDSTAFDYAGARRCREELDGRMEEFEAGFGNRSRGYAQRSYSVEARYRYQVWELAVTLSGAQIQSSDDVEEVREAFHAEHERVFSIRDPSAPLEFLLWKARLTIEAPSKNLRLRRSDVDAGGRNGHHVRTAYFDGVGLTEARVMYGPALTVGAEVEGPAIIEEPTTTVVVYPETRARLTPADNYLIEMGTS